MAHTPRHIHVTRLPVGSLMESKQTRTTPQRVDVHVEGRPRNLDTQHHFHDGQRGWFHSHVLQLLHECPLVEPRFQVHQKTLVYPPSHIRAPSQTIHCFFFCAAVPDGPLQHSRLSRNHTFTTSSFHLRSHHFHFHAKPLRRNQPSGMGGLPRFKFKFRQHRHFVAYTPQ